eukprot:1188205-Prorocentrum_minimum.AAC.2
MSTVSGVSSAPSPLSAQENPNGKDAEAKTPTRAKAEAEAVRGMEAAYGELCTPVLARAALVLERAAKPINSSDEAWAVAAETKLFLLAGGASAGDLRALSQLQEARHLAAAGAPSEPYNS